MTPRRRRVVGSGLLLAVSMGEELKRGKGMSRPCAVLDLMNQLRQASEDLLRLRRENERLKAEIAILRQNRADKEFPSRRLPKKEGKKVQPAQPPEADAKHPPVSTAGGGMIQRTDAHLVAAALGCATEVFEDAKAAEQWLWQECLALDFAVPADLLSNAEGLARVVTVLMRIQRNVYT